MFIPSTKDVTIEGDPIEADVIIDGVPHGTTPVTVELDNKKSHTIVISKQGYDSVSCVLTAEVKGSIVVLDVLGGLMYIQIDVARVFRSMLPGYSDRCCQGIQIDVAPLG